MKKIAISMMPASYGDCFLVNCNNSSHTNILIDTGFVSTYVNYLKPKLLKMKAVGEFLDLMIITHIDADHISGALKFLGENGHSDEAHIIKIKEIWHNSYRHLQQKDLDNREIENTIDKNIIKGITKVGYPTDTVIDKDFKRDIGARQGSSLATVINHNRYAWNSSFECKSISVENKKLIDVGKKVKIRLLSLDEFKLNNLKEYWKKELKKMGFKSNLDEMKIFDDAFEFLIAHEKTLIPKDFQKNISSSKKEIEDLMQEEFIEDNSVTNGSSISFVLEVKDKKILFLADSHPSIITRELKKIYGDNLTWFDAIKISHHGSKGNTSPELLDIIDSNNFFISTNGMKFNHPDLVTMCRIISRKTESTRNIIFNYETSVANYLNQNAIEEKFNYKVKILREGEEYYI